MFGFMFGVACLLGYMAVRKRERWSGLAFAHHHHDHAGPCGHERMRWGSPEDRGCDRGPRSSGRRSGRGRGFRRWFESVGLRRIFERLETTPGQERELKAALSELTDAAKTLRGEADKSRAEIAAALRASELDAERLGQLFARHDDLLTEVRKASVGALSRAHSALDEGQRRQLADLLERGRPF